MDFECFQMIVMCLYECYGMFRNVMIRLRMLLQMFTSICLDLHAF